MITVTFMSRPEVSVRIVPEWQAGKITGLSAEAVCKDGNLRLGPKLLTALEAKVFGTRDAGIYLLRSNALSEMRIHVRPEKLVVEYPFTSQGKMGVLQNIECEERDNNEIYLHIHGTFKRQAGAEPEKLKDTLLAPEKLVKVVTDLLKSNNTAV